jgi:predicted lipid-binding transport protein (Tim44 family)
MDVTSLIFLGLAVFVIWRLRSVLGQKTGYERPPEQPSAEALARRDAFRREQGAGQPANEDNIIRLPGAEKTPPADRWQGIATPDTPLAKALDEIAEKEPVFDAKAFLNGSKAAYEMIVLAFAKGDRQSLKELLAREVYEGFEKAISERENKGEKVQTTFVSIDKATLEAVEVRGRVAQITVRFLSKMITVTYDKNNVVIDGSPEAIDDVTDIWTFARTLATSDPTWQLVATESGL